MKISLVIVSYNQAQFLEEAIRSVLLQDSPPWELFVIDGGSTDGSVDLIRKYAPWLTGWVSEKDRGQSHAINKGFQLCTGDVVNWLCSDDLLLPGALGRITKAFLEPASVPVSSAASRPASVTAHPEVDVVAGNAVYRFEDGSQPDGRSQVDKVAVASLPAVNRIVQPSCFFRRRLLDRSPPLREELHYTMDLELWTRFATAGRRWVWIAEDLSVYRVTGQNKSFKGRQQTLAEIRALYAEYVSTPLPLWWWFSALWVPAAKVRWGAGPSVLRRLGGAAARGLEALLGTLYPKAHVDGFATSYRWYVIDPWLASREAALRPAPVASPSTHATRGASKPPG